MLNPLRVCILHRKNNYDDSKSEGEPFIPLNPPCFIEWESSRVDYCMWRIPNINNLAPISIDMWRSWASLSTNDIKLCQANALRGFSWIETSPPITTCWPMTVFGAPKYKCHVAAGAKIRGNFVTDTSQIAHQHKTKFWNWHMPFLRCSCNSTLKGGCTGQIVWFDHAVWYIINHLELFFNASSIQGRLVLMMSFLGGEARHIALDQVAFLFIWQFIFEAMHEQIAEPLATLLKAYGDAKGARIVEMLHC